MVINASRSSYSPLRSVCTSRSLITFVNSSNSLSTSLKAAALSLSLKANSTITGRSSSLDLIEFILLIVDWALDNLLVITCAACGSSQRFGTLACFSKSSAVSINLGRFKTCSIDLRVKSTLPISS